MSSRLYTEPEHNFLINLGMELFGDKFQPVEKIGYNAAISTGKEDLWPQGGLQTWIPTAAPIHLSSTDSADQGIGVTVEYLDTNWLPVTLEVFTDGSDGQTEVVTAITAIRINKAWISSGGPAAGKIYLYEDDSVSGGIPQTATLIHAVLEIVDQETKHAWYSIPDGYEGALLEWCASSVTTAQTSTSRIELRLFGSSFTAIGGPLTFAGDTKRRTMVIPRRLPAKSDIKISGVGTGSVNVEACLVLFLRKLAT